MSDYNDIEEYTSLHSPQMFEGSANQLDQLGQALHGLLDNITPMPDLINLDDQTQIQSMLPQEIEAIDAPQQIEQIAQAIQSDEPARQRSDRKRGGGKPQNYNFLNQTLFPLEDESYEVMSASDSWYFAQGPNNITRGRLTGKFPQGAKIRIVRGEAGKAEQLVRPTDLLKTARDRNKLRIFLGGLTITKRNNIIKQYEEELKPFEIVLVENSRSKKRVQ